MTRARRHAPATAALVVAGLAVLAGVAAPAATGPTPAATPVPSSASARDVPRFVDPPYREHRGDVVRVPVAVPFGGRATVTVRADDADYAANLTLGDGDGDGLVTLLWNTHAAGGGGAARTARAAAAGDSVGERTETPVDGPLPAGAYGLTARAPTTNATDAATVDLTPPGPANASVLRGVPALSGDLTDAEAVAAARGTSDLSASRPAGDGGHLPVGVEEVVVVELRVPGLAGALAAADGPNATARFRTLLGEALSVAVAEDVTTVSAEERGFEYRLRDAVGYRVLPDPANDTYFVVLGTAADAYAAGPGPPENPDVEYGDVVDVDVAATAARGTAAVRNLTVEFVAGDSAGFATTDDGHLPPAAANGTVAGESTLRAGERVTVRLESVAGDPFPVERRVRVGPDGGFEVSFDLAGVPPGTSFEAVLVHDGRTADEALAVVGPVADVSFADRTVFVQHVERVAVDRVETTGGGFVVVRRGAADGPVVGVSEHLPPGDHADVAVRLREDLDGDATLVATVHRDADADGEFDAGSDPVYPAGTPTAAARLVDRDGAATPTATPRSPSPSASPTPTATASAPPTETTVGHDDVPGPGAGAALVAVVLAAVVAALRAGPRRD